RIPSPNPGERAMKNVMKLQAVGDREVVVTRGFDAPRKLVWDAYTKPELLKRWLTGPPGWTFAVCEMDLRVGGKYRWVWRGPEGQELAVGGTYEEVVPGERLVSTERYDQQWYEG